MTDKHFACKYIDLPANCEIIELTTQIWLRHVWINYPDAKNVCEIGLSKIPKSNPKLQITIQKTKHPHPNPKIKVQIQIQIHFLKDA